MTLKSPAGPKAGFEAIGNNDVALFGLSAGERLRRFAAKAGLSAEARTGPRVLANLAYACDPAWFGYLRDAPGTVVTVGGRPALAHATSDSAAAALASAMTGTGTLRLPVGHRELRAEAASGVHSAELRKRETPFVMRLTADTADLAERASYDGAYKGVTDLLTLYLWRRPAFYLTRWAALAGLSPNLVTAVGAVGCLLGFWLFWIGHYWSGIGVGFVFMVLDTVDGKLARVTGTSSKWGEVFDHGIDLVHPPFWWWAWGHGLYAYGTPIESRLLWLVLEAILIGYIAQRLIEGWFIKRFGMHIHVWRRIDSRFRLITARRNPNMVILIVAMLFERPDLGLIAVAVWTVVSLVFHLARLAQAEVSHASTGKLESWLG